MSLRWRIFVAILAVVVVTVGGAVGLQYQAATEVFEGELEERVRAISASIRTEITQRHSGLEQVLEELTESDRGLKRVLATGQDSVLYGWASQFTDRGQVDLLKVLDSDFVIRSSGHWPGSFGAQEEAARRELYEAPARGWRLMEEQTPYGPKLALQYWKEMSGAGLRGHRVVVGWFVNGQGETELEEILARTGADLVAICSEVIAAQAHCIEVRSERVLPVATAVDWRHEDVGGLYLKSAKLLAGSSGPDLVVGLHRGRLDELEETFWVRTAGFAGVGLLTALAFGWFFALKIGSSLERLVSAALELGGGRRDVRVEAMPGTLPEVERLIEAFNAMATDLEASEGRRLQAERIATWQEIARSLAHELKNPLTPILGALKVVQRAHEKDHPEFEAILEEQSHAVREEVNRLRDMADSFARFARLPDPVPSQVDIAELVDAVAALYLSDSGEVAFERAGETCGLVVWADAAQLKIVFGNLIKNALEAMEGKGVLGVRVERGKYRSQPGIVIRVKDNGCGIDPALLDTIFTPYVSTKGERGTGLGLALVHRIVAEADGRVDVDSVESKGAEFIVWLPEHSST